VNFQIDQVVTWIHVPKPTLDLMGIVLGALTVAAVAAVLALVLGSAMGLLLIARNRRREGRVDHTRLGLLESSHP
jgi:hypothetical protein